MVPQSPRSSFRSFHTLQLLMHSSGETGEQFLHSWSKFRKISIMSVLASVKVCCDFMGALSFGGVCLAGKSRVLGMWDI